MCSPFQKVPTYRGYIQKVSENAYIGYTAYTNLKKPACGEG